MKDRALLALSLLVFAVSLEAGQTSGRQGAEARIRQAAQDWAKYWNTRQLDPLTALYAADAVVMPPHHEAVRGRQAIREFFQGVLNSGVTDIVHEATLVKVSGNQGYVLGRFSLLVPQKDGGPKQDRGKFLLIWERQPGGGWRIAVGSFSSDLPQ